MFVCGQWTTSARMSGVTGRSAQPSPRTGGAGTSRQRRSISRCSWGIVGPRSAGSTSPRTVWTRPTAGLRSVTTSGRRDAASAPENSRTTRPIASWIARSNWVPSTRMFAPSLRSSRALPSVIWPSTEVKPVAASTSALDAPADVGGQPVGGADLGVVLGVDAEHQPHDVDADRLEVLHRRA